MNSGNKIFDGEKTWAVRACSIKDLMELYGMSYKVLMKHIKAHEEQIGKKIGQFYTPKQVVVILETLGPPADVEIIYPH